MDPACGLEAAMTTVTIVHGLRTAGAAGTATRHRLAPNDDFERRRLHAADGAFTGALA
jgi:hypothetical protein